MRTTIDLNDDLFRRAKRKAADRGETLRELVEAALRKYLQHGEGHAGTYRFKWHVERGRMLPGVRLDDRDALYDMMDSR